MYLIVQFQYICIAVLEITCTPGKITLSTKVQGLCTVDMLLVLQTLLNASFSLVLQFEYDMPMSAFLVCFTTAVSVVLLFYDSSCFLFTP